ncbi:MAG TPA: sigma 54-interacting transcriptional regulator, partial [Nannocystis sp.]
MALPLVDHFGELYGRSAAMRGLFARFAHMAERGDQSHVLVRGKPGTGRQLVARVLHAGSARSRRPFVVLDCASVAPELLASHLFGRGCSDAPGRFDVCGGLEAAHGGTLLLKAVDSLPLALQGQLLAVLQRGVLTREGEQHARKFDARLICATDRDIQRLVAEGKFNQELYRHLSGVQVDLPALCDRDDDVAFLASEVFLKRLCDGTGRTRRLAPEALDALRAHAWPQNLSELRCAVERGFYAREDEWIRPADLGLSLGVTFHDGLLRKLVEIEALFANNHSGAVAGFERLYFSHLLLSHPSKARAARFASMTNEGFRLALKRLGLGARCAG